MFGIRSLLFRKQKAQPPISSEALPWAAERTGLTREQLLYALTAARLAALQAAYEAWKMRMPTR